MEVVKIADVNKEEVEKEIKELEDKKADLDKQIDEKKKSIEGK